MERSFSTLAALIGDGPTEDLRTLAAVEAIIARIREQVAASNDEHIDEHIEFISHEFSAWFGAHDWTMAEDEIASARADLIAAIVALYALLRRQHDGRSH